MILFLVTNKQFRKNSLVFNWTALGNLAKYSDAHLSVEFCQFTFLTPHQFFHVAFLRVSIWPSSWRAAPLLLHQTELQNHESKEWWRSGPSSFSYSSVRYEFACPCLHRRQSGPNMARNFTKHNSSSGEFKPQGSVWSLHVSQDKTNWGNEFCFLFFVDNHAEQQLVAPLLWETEAFPCVMDILCVWLDCTGLNSTVRRPII